jgi:Domain of unknown function (DUF4371)
LADSLRAAVCEVLRENSTLLTIMSERLPYLLDDDATTKFRDIDARLDAMTSRKTFAGSVEMLATAFILNCQIHVFSSTGRSDANGDNLRLVAKFPPNLLHSGTAVQLVHTGDTRKQEGHFDLILSSSKMSSECCTDISSISLQALLASVDHQNKPTFEDTLLDCSGSTTVRDNDNDSSGNDNVPPNDVCRLEVDTASQLSIKDGDVQYPAIWNAEQADNFRKKYPWLLFSKGYLGCASCQQITTLGVMKTMGSKMSKEWISASVTFNGNGRQAQLSSLRKKIHEHDNSGPHKTGQLIHMKAADKTFEKVIAEQSKHMYDSTSRIFRTVYASVKNNRPFTDTPKLIQLQQMNGLDMGLILHSEYTATTMVEFIGTEMRKKLCNTIIQSGAKIAIIVDESTTVSAKSVLILYLRSYICGKVTTFFLDLIELENSDALSMTTYLKSCLKSHGFTENYLAQHLVSICSDGASVMVGSKSGLLTEFSRQYPRIIRWHCLCHRIELSVGDTLDDIGATNHFKIFMDKLYAVYSQSPKNQRELATCANEMEIQLKKIGKMLSVRWVASSYRAVSAVHRSYAALHRHFVSASTDVNRDSKARQTFLGLAKTLASENFVLNLGLMRDSLRELANVSESLQADGVTMQRAYQVISRTIRALEAMKDCNTFHIQEAEDAVKQRCYQSVAIDRSTDARGQRQPAIDRRRFLQSLVDNLRSRLYTTIASKTSSDSTAFNSNISLFETLIDQVCYSSRSHQLYAVLNYSTTLNLLTNLIR